MNNLVTNTLVNIADNNISNYTQTIRDTINCKEYLPYNVYSPLTYTTTSMYCLPMAKLETDSNKLKINIKKFQIKFNFNL